MDDDNDQHGASKNEQQPAATATIATAAPPQEVRPDVSATEVAVPVSDSSPAQKKQQAHKPQAKQQTAQKKNSNKTPKQKINEMWSSHSKNGWKTVSNENFSRIMAAVFLLVGVLLAYFALQLYTSASTAPTQLSQLCPKTEYLRVNRSAARNSSNINATIGNEEPTMASKFGIHAWCNVRLIFLAVEATGFGVLAWIFATHQSGDFQGYALGGLLLLFAASEVIIASASCVLDFLGHKITAGCSDMQPSQLKDQIEATIVGCGVIHLLLVGAATVLFTV